MIVFAFCVFGLLAACLKMGCAGMINKGRDYRISKAYQDRDDFIQSIIASPEEIEYALSDKDYSDVIDDIDFIIHRKMSSNLIRHCSNGLQYINNAKLTYKQVIKYIRLAKIGKACDDYDVLVGTMVVKGSDHYDEVFRFYSLLAKYYENAGIHSHVVEKECTSTGLVTLNLSIFHANV